MLFPSLAALTALLPLAAPAQPIDLQSAEHDLLRLEIGAVAAPLAMPVPAPKPASERLVTVCLENATASLKGVGTRRDMPRLTAGPGEEACTRLEPTEHTVFFFKERPGGALVPVLSYRLDLRGRDGLQASIDWQRDRPRDEARGGPHDGPP